MWVRFLLRAPKSCLCYNLNVYEEDRNVLIKRVAELTEENNKMLHRMQRARRWSQFFTILRWLVVVALTLGAYYYIQPWLESWQQFYQERSAELDSLTETINSVLQSPR